MAFRFFERQSEFIHRDTAFIYLRSLQAQDGRRSDREDRQRRQRHVNQSVQPAAEDSGGREQDEPGDRRAEQEVRPSPASSGSGEPVQAQTINRRSVMGQEAGGYKAMCGRFDFQYHTHLICIKLSELQLAIIFILR